MLGPRSEQLQWPKEDGPSRVSAQRNRSQRSSNAPQGGHVPNTGGDAMNRLLSFNPEPFETDSEIAGTLRGGSPFSHRAPVAPLSAPAREIGGDVRPATLGL